MFNQAFSIILTELADLSELNADNPFRIRAFRRAAQVVEDLPQDLGALTREQWLEIPGIGKGVADMIEEFKAKGQISELNKLKKKFPAGLLELMHLGGLGPKRTAVLYKKLNIDSVAKLSAAAKKGILKDLPGFGEKIEKNLIANISFVETSSQRILLPAALKIAAEIRRHLEKSPHIDQLELAGSARRWKETVGDLDFLCTSASPEKAMDHFLSFPDVQRKLGSGDTKASVVLKNGLQCDFRVVGPESFGAALLYFTGSKEHNVRLREIAIKKGYTLNEYGLSKLKEGDKGKKFGGRTEEEVYKKLGLAWIPPELREDRGEIQAAMKNQLPKLIEEKDVLGDFHNHTTLSDGHNTLEQMVEAARAQQWKWFFSADHSPSLTIASGLKIPVLKKKMADVKKLDQKFKDFRVFTSSEVDILGDGQMDYPDEILAELDCVVASVHSRFNQSEEEMTERLCRAIRNPNVDILGHISGRKINARASYPLNYAKVFETALETETAIEINGQSERQELSDVQVKRAVELGVPLALNTDAHSIHELDNMRIAVHIARRGWAEASDILNTFSTEKIKQWLKN